MYSYKNIDIEETVPRHMMTVKLNRPEAHNALDSGTLRDIEDMVLTHCQNQELRVLIITGTGKFFSAGAEIAEMADMSPGAAEAFSELGQRVFTRVESLPAVTIAVINGPALGAGCELALACDMRLASRKAKLGMLELNLGIIPGFGGTQRLPRAIGISRAKELIFTGRILRGEEAKAIGLLDDLLPDADLMDEAAKIARVIMSRPAAALRAAKEAIRASESIESGFTKERRLFASLFGTHAQRENMRVHLEKSR